MNIAIVSSLFNHALSCVLHTLNLCSVSPLSGNCVGGTIFTTGMLPDFTESVVQVLVCAVYGPVCGFPVSLSVSHSHSPYCRLGIVTISTCLNTSFESCLVPNVCHCCDVRPVCTGICTDHRRHLSPVPLSSLWRLGSILAAAAVHVLPGTQDQVQQLCKYHVDEEGSGDSQEPVTMRRSVALM